MNQRNVSDSKYNMNFINNIVSLFTTDYIVGTPECDQAFRIFNVFGWTITVLSVGFVIYIMLKGKTIEAKIIAQDRNSRKKKGL